MESNPLRMGIRLLSPKVTDEGLTPHGLLNSFGPPSVTPGPDGRFLRTPR